MTDGNRSQESDSGSTPERAVSHLLAAHRDHARRFEENRFVYPVLSRRSRGISIGVNLNPDKICNFDCIYCQVDRRSESETRFVETDRLYDELTSMVEMVASGQIFEHPKFASLPDHLRRFNDIAFSGDGEPTTHRNFPEIVAESARIKHRFAAPEVKLVLITNASMFHRPHVQRALTIFDDNQGEIWAKLDAGSAEYYHLIERTTIPFQRILDNLTEAARVRPLVIQSLFMRVDDAPPCSAEIDAYAQRLNDIVAAGGAIKSVQIYTVARPPAEANVTALSKSEITGIAQRVEAATGLTVELYAG